MTDNRGKPTSIWIDPRLWKSFRKQCIDNNTTASDRLRKLIKQDLK